jgi:hypothetical protein
VTATRRDDGLRKLRSLTWGSVAGATVLAGFGAGFAAVSRPAHHANTSDQTSPSSSSASQPGDSIDDGGTTWSPPATLAPPSQVPSSGDNGTNSNANGSFGSDNGNGPGFGGGGGPAVSGAS